MEKALYRTVLVLLIATILSILSYYIDINTYKSIIQEDGIIEYLSAFTLLAGSALLFLRLIKVFKLKSGAWIFFNIVMILGLFFAFGEEISWGQRIFSIESGDFFKDKNLQEETNFHNLELGGVKINKIIFSYGLTAVFGVYFLLLQVLYKRWNKLKKLIDKFGVPVPMIHQSALIIGATIIISIIPDSKIWEIWECIFALIFLLVLIKPYNSAEGVLHKKRSSLPATPPY